MEYLLADLAQQSNGPDREAILRNSLDLYERYLSRLDDYGLLSVPNKKLYERYVEDPFSFTLAPASDAAARRGIKVARFREEKELKQKLEVSIYMDIYTVDYRRVNSHLFFFFFFFESIYPRIMTEFKAMTKTFAVSTLQKSIYIPTKLSNH